MNTVKAFLLAHLGATAAVGGLLATVAWLFIALHQRDAANRRIGAITERLHIADSVLVVERVRLARADTLLVHDTVTLRRSLVRLDTLRDTLLAHLTDTVRVKEFIASVDTTKGRCSETSGDCQEFRASALRTIGTLRGEVADLKAMPAKPRRLCGLGGAAGYGTTYDKSGFHVGPSLTAGVACSF